MGKPKQKDFEKNKLRLGKGRGLKKQSVTHTPLTVKTRRIEIAQQSVAVERATEVTQRKLDLPALITQLGHYSDSVRQEALAGVTEWCTRYEAELQRHVGALSAALVERVHDLSGAVRRALLNSTLPAVFARVPVSAMSAHMDVWCAHLVAALSHVHVALKVDALRLCALLLASYAPLFLAPPARVAQLRTALVPLAAHHAVLARAAPDAPFLLVRVLDAYLRALAPLTPVVPEPALTLPRIATLSFAALSSTAALESGALQDVSWSALLPPVVELWVEAVAAAQERTLSSAEATHMSALAALLRRLLVTLAHDAPTPPLACLGLVRKHVVDAFPLTLRCAGDVRTARHEVNAHLGALMLHAPSLASERSDAFSARVAEHVMSELRALVAQGRVSDDALVPVAPLLELVLASPLTLLSHAPLCDALLALSRAASPHTPVRRTLLTLSRALLVDLPAVGVSVSAPEEWLLLLAKFLWQLGTSAPELSALALDTLRDALARVWAARLDSAILCQALCPLFCVMVPAKRRLVLGPFTAFSTPLQRRLLQVVACVKPLSPALLIALARSLSHEAIDVVEFCFALEILSREPNYCKLEDFVSLWVTLLRAILQCEAAAGLALPKIKSLVLALHRYSLMFELPLFALILPKLNDLLVEKVSLQKSLLFAFFVSEVASVSPLEILPFAIDVISNIIGYLSELDHSQAQDVAGLVVGIIHKLPQCLYLVLERFLPTINPQAPDESSLALLMALLNIPDVRRSPLTKATLLSIEKECSDRLLVGRLFV